MRGCGITYSGLANLGVWAPAQIFSVTSADRASHLAGLEFDAAVWYATITPHGLRDVLRPQPPEPAMSLAGACRIHRPHQDQ